MTNSGLLVAVDPGIRGSGVAVFEGQELQQAAYVVGNAEAQRAEAWVAMADAVREFIGARQVAQLVIELPQAYVVARQKGDQNDLVHLAAVVGGITVTFRTSALRVYLPGEWKGQVPKAVMNERVKGRLSPAETARISCRKQSLLHNVLDGIGLGLAFLGRL